MISTCICSRQWNKRGGDIIRFGKKMLREERESVRRIWIEQRKGRHSIMEFQVFKEGIMFLIEFSLKWSYVQQVLQTITLPCVLPKLLTF